MNYQSDEEIMDGVFKHFNDAVQYFPRDRIVCLALQGSQNYGLSGEDSDIDTKLIVTPSFRDIAMNSQPVSTTHVRPNNEHIDFKDVRLYLQTFRKANINFMEILFSPYTIVNPYYYNEWNRLVEAREAIARYDVVRAIHAMRGTMHTKYKLVTNASDNRAEAIAKFGYAPKELYILKRTEEFIERYITGEPYADCLVSKQAARLKIIKSGHYDVNYALRMAKECLDRTNELCDKFLETYDKTVNQEVDALLNDVQYNIMKLAMKKEFGE